VSAIVEEKEVLEVPLTILYFPAHGNVILIRQRWEYPLMLAWQTHSFSCHLMHCLVRLVLAVWLAWMILLRRSLRCCPTLMVYEQWVEDEHPLLIVSALPEHWASIVPRSSSTKQEQQWSSR